MESKIVNVEDYSSIMQDKPSDLTSSRYSFISTKRVLDVLAKEDWFPVSVIQSSVRNKSKQGFQKHLIRLRKGSEVSRTLEIDQLIAELVLTTAHDGLASFLVGGGVNRCVCSNQMTVSNATIQSHRIRHQGYTDDKVLEAVYSVMEDTPKMMGQIELFRNVGVNLEDRKVFGEKALSLVIDEERLNEKYDKDRTIEELIAPRRTADKEENLWTTLNIVQEKLLKGDRFLVKKGSAFKANKHRQVRSIDRTMNLNKDLWELAATFVTDKAGT